MTNPTKGQIERACKLCAEHNHDGCTQIHYPDVKFWICKGWLKRLDT